MFHLLLGLPVISMLAMLGVMAAVILCFLLEAVFFGGFLVRLLCRDIRWPVWLLVTPGLLGAGACLVIGFPAVALVFVCLYAIAGGLGWVLGALAAFLWRWLVR